jgi:excisionase family DNA binding protein
MNNNDKKQYLSTAELAKALGISRVAVFKRIQKGQIPAEKIGRSYVIATEDAEAIINGSSAQHLTENQKTDITKAVKKTVKEYGETLRLLGKE